MKGGIIYILAFRDTDAMDDGSTLASTDCWLRLKEPPNNAKTISLVLRVRYCSVCFRVIVIGVAEENRAANMKRIPWVDRPVHTKMKLNFILFCWFFI